MSANADEVKLEAGITTKKEDTKTSSARLNKLLAESAAFRRYYMSADKDRLVLLNEDS